MNKTMRNAFWISPQSELLEVNFTHQQLIISYSQEAPNIFGWSMEEIKKVYEKNREMKWFGMEGTDSRTELVFKCLKDGWVRLRFHSRPSSCWHIQLHQRLDKELVRNILNAFLLPLNKGEVSDFTCKSTNPSILIINTLGDTLLESYSVDGAIKYLEAMICL